MADTSSPSRTAGVVIRKVTVGGQEFTLSQPDRVRKAADEEAVVLSRRLDMLPSVVRACTALPTDEQRAWRRDYINAMMCGIATPEEWSAYYRSMWELAFRFWNAMDPADRGGRSLVDGVTWCYEMVSSEGVTKDEMESLWVGIRMVSQEEALKNSSGSTEPPPTPSMEGQSLGGGQ